MTTTATRLLDDALKLPEADRADLAACLFASLTSDMLLDSAWEAKISRRIEAIDHGTVRLVPWEKARNRIFCNG